MVHDNVARRLATLFAAIPALVLALAGRAQVPSSTLIVNAVVIDGTGSPGRRADVRIHAGKIEEVGPPNFATADEVVDAKGLTLAPGFIDTHSHHDRGLVESRSAAAVVSQGITTIVVGQDGSSAFPLAQSLARFEEQPAAVNVASYVGHGTLRRQVMGAYFKRPASAEELTKLEELLRTEMLSGALGLSTGLEYDPGIHPRGFGAFPRVLARYVRERGVLALEEAVRRMTSPAARNMGIADRGTIAAGQFADLVLFSPAAIADRASTSNPQATSAGVVTVWVNGEVVFNDGTVSGKYPGRVLRRSQTKE